MTDKELRVSEAQIAVHWQEESKFAPAPSFIAQANMTDPEIYHRFSLENFPDCFKEYADLLDWDRNWHTMLDTSEATSWKWFVGGLINAFYNCVDRHLQPHRNKAAFIWVPEQEDKIASVAERYSEMAQCVVLGRGYNYATAFE